MSTKFSDMTPEQKREYKRLAARKSREALQGAIGEVPKTAGLRDSRGLWNAGGNGVETCQSKN
jgi:hypothetical protein